MAAEAAPIGAEPIPKPKITPTTRYFSESFGGISEELAFLSGELDTHVGVQQDPDIRNVFTAQQREIIAKMAHDMQILSGLVETHFASTEQPIHQSSVHLVR